MNRGYIGPYELPAMEATNSQSKRADFTSDHLVRESKQIGRPIAKDANLAVHQ